MITYIFLAPLLRLDCNTKKYHSIYIRTLAFSIKYFVLAWVTQEVSIGIFPVNPKPKFSLSLTTSYILQLIIKYPAVYLVSLGLLIENCPFSESSLPNFFSIATRASALLTYAHAIWHSARSMKISGLLDALYSPLGSFSSNNTILPFIILQPQCRTNWQELMRKEKEQLRGKTIKNLAYFSATLHLSSQASLTV